jgi:glycosyltransferase involved in cell wall biosynthesis
MPAISATIITHNEAANIARAIRSLDCADEVVVVDAESVDATRTIAADMGAKVVVHPWNGFVAQKNFASGQAQHDWILSLDADEEFDGTASKALAEWKRQTPQAAGYRWARRAKYLGRWIRHSGWYPDCKTRLYDRRHGRWVGTHVHESVVVEGKVEQMPGEILHYTCDSLEEHRQRIEVYTDLAAREMFERGQRANALQRFVTPQWVFLNTYVFRAGFLDGYQGYEIARMAALYLRRKYEKLAAMYAEARE